jgi:RNA polymerase sigma-70 factor (ECF subfamily)
MTADAHRKPDPGSSGNVAVLRFQGTDAQLLDLVRRKDATAFAVVYDRFGDDVNRLIWRCLGADPDHDDVVHEAFLQILKGLPRVVDPRALRGWVATVAINTARTELRKRRFRRAFWSADPVPDVAVSAGDPECHELLRRTYAILDRLPTDERIAFILRFVEQHALAEVAELVGCSLATVKRRISRATKRFGELAARDPELADLARAKKWGGMA